MEELVTAAEDNQARASSPGFLVSLQHEAPPFPDGGPTIRCCCAGGCRRRCPLGRRLPCASCGVLVGPCCGLRPVPAPLPGDAKTSHAVVCHVCLGGGPADRCRWDPDPGDFRPMSAEERFRWKRCSEQLEARLAGLIWGALDAEVRTSTRAREAPPETSCQPGEASSDRHSECGSPWHFLAHPSSSSSSSYSSSSASSSCGFNVVSRVVSMWFLLWFQCGSLCGFPRGFGFAIVMIVSIGSWLQADPAFYLMLRH